MTLAPILAAPPVVQAHILAALAALLLGLVNWLRPARDRWHRLLGWAWVAAMAVTALTAAFIFTLHVVGPFSPIHLLIPVVLFSLWRGVAHARAGRIAAHRRWMTGLYVQALGIAGLFTLLPGRIMNAVLFPAAPWTGFALSALAFSALLLWLLRRERRRARADAPG